MSRNLFVRYGQLYGDKTQTKAALNAKIADVKSDVCKKLKLDPNCYALLYNGKVLDSKSTVQQSNIPNSVTLELKKVADEEKGIFVLVFICLCLEIMILTSRMCLI